MHTWERRTNGQDVPEWARGAIPLLGMVTGIAWAVAFVYIFRQIGRMRLKSLEVKELELKSKMS